LFNLKIYIINLKNFDFSFFLKIFFLRKKNKIKMPSTIINSIRGYMFLVTLVIGAGILAFGAGWGVMLYKDVDNEPFLTWDYWRYESVNILMMIALILMWIYAFDVMTSTGKIRGMLFWIMLIGVAYIAVFVVWEIIIWTKCDEILTPGPPPVFKYPHCVNRDYPTMTSPDVVFLLTLFGAAAGGVGMLICAYIINQITCASLAMRSIRSQGLSTMNRNPAVQDEFGDPAQFEDESIGSPLDITIEPSLHDRNVGFLFHSSSKFD
jgi:hypothetical protein